MTDTVTETLAGLISGSLGTSNCAETYRYDIRHSLGRAKTPAVAVYCANEEILETRGERNIHNSEFRVDYYQGAIPREKIGDHWAQLRNTAALVIKEINRNITVISISSIESMIPQRVQYGYFQPAASIDATAYLGWTLRLDVKSVETEYVSGSTDLEYLTGTITFPASGAFGTGSFVEFVAF